MNKVTARIGPVPVIILTSTDAFASKHVSEAFTTITLEKDGQPYLPNGPGFFRYRTSDTVEMEDSLENFAVRQRTASGDSVLLSGYRTFPTEAIEPVARVKVGDAVKIVCRATGNVVVANVLAVERETISVDYYPMSGDSGSVVTDMDGMFVGFVSGRIPNVGVVIIPPDTSMIAFPVPPPAPVAPPPSNQALLDAYQNGYQAARRDLGKLVTALAQSLN
jgi:hypothetical protein